VARRLVQDPNTESGRECMDQQDNDGDGKADCEDTDCSTGRMAQICEAMKANGGTSAWTPTPEDPNTESGRECRDQQDNDGDGKSDCEDPDCAESWLCRAGAGGGSGRSQTPEDPNTESGMECRDQQDNDGDGTSDCDDPDCATSFMCRAGGGGGGGGGGGRRGRGPPPPPAAPDPTCFTPGSEYTSARCCNTAVSPGGDSSCWGGGYTFTRCCAAPPPPPAGPAAMECTMPGFGTITTEHCPAPTAGSRVPTECPQDCASTFTTWKTKCDSSGVLAQADRLLGGALTPFVAKCAAAFAECVAAGNCLADSGNGH